MIKDKLTQQQSAHLVELGVSADKASASQSCAAYGNGARGIMNVPTTPIFTLADVMELLPKEIKEGVTAFHLNIDFPIPNQVAARYIDPDDIDNDILGVMCDELIDALYELLCDIIRIKHSQQ